MLNLSTNLSLEEFDSFLFPIAVDCIVMDGTRFNMKIDRAALNVLQPGSFLSHLNCFWEFHLNFLLCQEEGNNKWLLL